MSMNIQFIATRLIQVVKTGKFETQTETFCFPYETPTSVSFDIKTSSDPIQSYKDWVISVSADEQVPVYADDDFWGDGPIIGYETMNHGVDHCDEFDAWIKDKTQCGFEIKTEIGV